MPIALIFDCGATNIRTIAISETGELIASHHIANQTVQGQESPQYHIWDIDTIWNNLLICARQTIAQLPEKNYDAGNIITIGVTTFGVDGALFDETSNQLYPVISWKCPRTKEKVERLADLVNTQELYMRNGVGSFPFNTLYKFLWLKEEKTQVLTQADHFLFISSMLNYRLTGKVTTDRTMAGTSMMTDLESGDWDAEILSLLDLDPEFFPPLVHAGEVIGPLQTALCKALNLPQSPQVVSCGHDTQFALFGSGAKLNQPVLSSGTWEILMMRTAQATPDTRYIKNGLTTEFDAVSGLFNPGVQWLGSAVLEWLKKLMFADIQNSKDYYSKVIELATQVPPGANAIRLEEIIDLDNLNTLSINGLSIDKNRIEIYRSALEFLALKLNDGLNILQTVSHAQSDSILCVGGGSKNQLWNQIRADVLGIPIDVVDMPETTVLGAAMFAFAGVGLFDSPEQAQEQMSPHKIRVYPSMNQDRYQKIFAHKRG